MSRDKEGLGDFLFGSVMVSLAILMSKFILMSRIICDYTIVVCLRGVIIYDDKNNIFEQNIRYIYSDNLKLNNKSIH